MHSKSADEQALRAENADLRLRLDEAEHTLRAIRAGEVDALVVETETGPQIYTLQGTDAEQNRFRGEMLAQVSDAVIAVDLEEHITFLNPAAERHYCICADDVLGRKLTEIYTQHWPNPADETAYRAALRECGEWRGEMLQRIHDGREIHVESSITTLCSPRGEPIGMVAAIRDITERKQSEAVLREADRRKDEFLAILAHELRNPLAPIRTGLEVMKLSVADQETVDEVRSMMERQIGQMVRLVDDLMDVSRITRGKIELRKERIELRSVVNSALETSRPLIEEMGHQLVMQLPPQPLIVHADITRLAQVFLNLLNNAAKYSNPGSQIFLTVEQQGGQVTAAVRDTGIGMAADQLPHIFDMFTQVDRSLERSQGGLGIGLSLVKGLVEMHGGQIEAHSAGPGQGSEFVVRLPLVIDTSTPVPEDSQDRAAANSTFRILIVDDNRDGADTLAKMLRMMGNDTWTAYDGQEGMEFAEQFRPEVVLCDIGLPKVNGYEVCRRIRRESWGASVVVIAVTGWGQDDDRRRSQAAGFDAHIVKPVDPVALVKLLAMSPSAAAR